MSDLAQWQTPEVREFKALFLYGDGGAVHVSQHQHHDPNSADAIGELQEGETRWRSIPSSAWNEAITSVDIRARASAWYHVTYSQEWIGRCSTSLAEEQEGDFTDHHDNCSPILVSFPWVAALKVLAAIKKDNRKISVSEL